MTGAPKRMTPEQLRMAYRYAVERCLLVFCGVNAAEAEALVVCWWGRLSAGRGLRSGFFLHAEAIDTAADLARREEIPLIEESRTRYRALLDEASARAVRAAELRDEVAENVLPDEVEGLFARQQQGDLKVLAADPMMRG